MFKIFKRKSEEEKRQERLQEMIKCRDHHETMMLLYNMSILLEEDNQRRAGYGKGKQM